MKTVIIENNELRLNSHLDELAFGKTNYSSIVTQGGILAKCNSTQEEMALGRYHFSLEDWYFSEVKSFDVSAEETASTSPFVFYCGKSLQSSEKTKTLLEYFEAAGKKDAGKTEKDEMFKAAFLVCSVLTQVALSKTAIPLNGAGGILVDLSDTPSVLFLPENLFRYSANALPKIDFANAHGCWTNSTLIDLPALCFLRGVIAYKMLTGRFPFADSDEVRRNADIFDKKFLPLEMCLNGVNAELSKEVNKALQLNANVVSVPGKKVKGKANEDLTPTADFPLDLLFTANQNLTKNNLTDEDFQAKADAYLKSQSSKVEAKRKFRRNKSTIFTVILVALVLSAIIRNSIKARGEEFTTRGLTSTETIQAYFYGMNTKDSTLASNVIKNRKLRGFSDTISQMYVISKQRQNYSRGDNGFVEPERWLLYVNNAETDAKTGIFGCSNLYIDGKPSDIDISIYTVAQRPDPLTEENGHPLTKGTTTSHQVDYYLLHSEGTDTDDYGIVAEHFYGVYVLTFSSKQWHITDIQLESETVEFDSYEFKKEYYQALKDTDGDVQAAVKRINYKYSWLPTEKAIDDCIKRIYHERQEYAQEFEAFFK